jgi:hypothetical protein
MAVQVGKSWKKVPTFILKATKNTNALRLLPDQYATKDGVGFTFQSIHAEKHKDKTFYNIFENRSDVFSAVVF